MTLSYTPRFKLAVPDFLTEPWHSEFAQAMESIDQILYNVLIAQSTSLWLNSTVYGVGDLVINPDSGAIFTCSVANTSTASPQTFTQELAAHPTYWTVLAPTLATQSEAEGGTENTKYMSPLRTKQGLSALQSQTSPVVPNSGIFYANSNILLGFTPQNGNKIKINGTLFDIPVAGIVGLANTNVYVSSIAGQNLAANTTYIVTAFNNAGVVTANYNAVNVGTTHRPSETVGNEGVEVLFDGIEFPGYTVIGIVRTNASAQFVDNQAQRLVRSWFNRSATPMQTWLSATQNTVSNTYDVISTGLKLEWVNFKFETVSFQFNGPFSAVAAAAEIHVSIGLDGSLSPQNTWGYNKPAAGALAVPISISLMITSAIGYHSASPLYHTTGANQIFAVVNADASGSRPTFRGMVTPYEAFTSVS